MLLGKFFFFSIKVRENGNFSNGRLRLVYFKASTERSVPFSLSIPGQEKQQLGTCDLLSKKKKKKKKKLFVAFGGLYLSLIHI